MIRKGNAHKICARLLKASRIWREKIWWGPIVTGKKTRREASDGEPDIWRIDDIGRTWQDDKRNGGK